MRSNTCPQCGHIVITPLDRCVRICDHLWHEGCWNAFHEAARRATPQWPEDYEDEGRQHNEKLKQTPNDAEFYHNTRRI